MAFGKLPSHPFVITLILLSMVTLQKPGSLHSASSMLANALPITSKPIENTAENLAWQAWLMLPPEQKLLEKSRKVTPKSIFTLPFRQCPEGHTLANSRCIPTVQIDQTQLLTDQLLSLFGGSDATDGQQVTYDYDDEETMDDLEFGALAYDQPQRPGAGDAGTGAVYDEQQPPSADEPLKFSIFQQKFPTVDYAESGGEGSGNGPVVNDGEMLSDGQRNDTKPATVINVTQFLEAVGGYLQKHGHLPTNDSAAPAAVSANNATNVSISEDLLASSSQISSSTTTLLATTTEPEGFSIDAIVLPAGGLKGEPAHNLEPQRGQLHKVSLFKNDNSVQFLPSDVLTTHHSNHQHVNQHDHEQQDMVELLKVDALLPLRSANLTQSATAVPSLEQREPAQNSATTPTKDERIRSAVDLVAETTLTTATTAMDDDTTDFQMDASTSEMLEVGVTQPQEHEAQRLAEEEEQRKRRLNKLKHVILKKSKVEPVVKAQLQEQTVAEGNATDETQSNTTPLPTTTTTATTATATGITDADTLATSDDATTDRFLYQHAQVADGALRQPAADNGNAVTETIATDTTIANNNNDNDSTGEINIEQELRAINDLVKGRRRPHTTTPSSATTSETSTVAVDEENAAAAAASGTTFSVGGKDSQDNKQQQLYSETTSSATTTTTTEYEEKKSTDQQTLEEKSSTLAEEEEEIIDSTTALNGDISSSTSTASTATTAKNEIEVSTKSTSADEETARSSTVTFENSTPSGELAASTTTTPTASTTSIAKMESTSDSNEISSSSTTLATPPSTIWSKIMPIFSFATTPEATDENPKKRIDSDARGTSLLFTFRANSLGAVEPAATTNNRRNRNSKIRKFDEDLLRTTDFDAESLPEHTKWEESSSVATTNVGSRDGWTYEQMSSSSNAPTTISTTTTVSPLTTVEPTIEPVSSGSYEPFWWLPLGWSLNGSSTTKTTDSSETPSAASNNNEELPPDDGMNSSSERTQDPGSLLLRFWSAFPGNHIKAKA